jgi:hypothetical protein
MTLMILMLMLMLMLPLMLIILILLLLLMLLRSMLILLLILLLLLPVVQFLQRLLNNAIALEAPIILAEDLLGGIVLLAVAAVVSF